MKRTSKTTAGIRAGTFSTTVRFLTEVLSLELICQDKEKEFAQFKLPSGQMLEVLGPKNIWHTFTTPPYWEVIVADIRHTKES